MIRELNDGYGPATCYSNGVEVGDCVIYANTETGEIRQRLLDEPKDADGSYRVESVYFENLTIRNHYPSAEAFAAHEAVIKSLGEQPMPANPTVQDYMDRLHAVARA